MPAQPECPCSGVSLSRCQNHNSFAIATEVNAVAGAEVDLVFIQARADAFSIRQISLLHTRQGDGHLGSGGSVERFQPAREGFVSLFVNVTSKLDH